MNYYMIFFVAYRIPASVLATHPLVLTALSSLTSDVLSEAAVNGNILIYIIYYLL